MILFLVLVSGSDVSAPRLASVLGVHELLLDEPSGCLCSTLSLPHKWLLCH